MIECRGPLDDGILLWGFDASFPTLFRSFWNLGDKKVVRVILCEAVSEALKYRRASTFQS